MHLYLERLLSQVTCGNSHFHTLMAVAAMQGANQHIRSSWGFSQRRSTIVETDHSDHFKWENLRRVVTAELGKL